MVVDEVPFFANTDDNTHCVQAVMKSVLAYFWPEREFSWEELDHMSAKQPGLWTWPAARLMAMHDLGLEIIDIDGFDIEAFVADPEQYLTDFYGETAAKEQIRHSDLAQERQLYREYVGLNRHQLRQPGLVDIRNLLDQGYLVECNVNAFALDEMPGYSGHSVLIYGYVIDRLLLHDPGLPPRSARWVSDEIFMKAWAYPTPKSQNLTAYRR